MPLYDVYLGDYQAGLPEQNRMPCREVGGIIRCRFQSLLKTAASAETMAIAKNAVYTGRTLFNASACSLYNVTVQRTVA